MNKQFFILFFIIGISACVKKPTKSDLVSRESRQLIYPDSNWSVASRYPENFTFKAKMDYADRQANLSFVANCRIRKDSLIWLSFMGPFGIEVARALIDRDSARIWNKLSNEKITMPVSSLSRYVPFKPTFYDVQDFLLGNPLLLSPQKPIITDELSFKTFKQEDYQFSISHKIDTKNYTLLTLLLKDKMERQRMDATFGRYEPLSNNLFSTLREIAIQRGEQNIQINADIYKFSEGEKLDFPFW